MVHVRIASLSLDPRTNQPVIILRPVEPPYEDRLLPIWIGHAEATAILLSLEGAEPPRPLTHDLVRNVLENLEVLVERVEVTRLEEGTFYAALVLRGEERTLAIDARPSDSIALAVRTGSPIYVSETVLQEASVPAELIDSSESGGAEDEIERFRAFLEDVNPSDFSE